MNLINDIEKRIEANEGNIITLVEMLVNTMGLYKDGKLCRDKYLKEVSKTCAAIIESSNANRVFSSIVDWVEAYRDDMMYEVYKDIKDNVSPETLEKPVDDQPDNAQS